MLQLAQSGRDGTQSSSTIRFYAGPGQIGRSPPTSRRGVCFTQFTTSTANLFPRHPLRHTREACLTRLQGDLWPAQGDTYS